MQLRDVTPEQKQLGSTAQPPQTLRTLPLFLARASQMFVNPPPKKSERAETPAEDLRRNSDA